MVHSDSDLILHNSSVLIDKEPKSSSMRCRTNIAYLNFFGSIIYGTDESELILQPHFYFRY
ncbi:hypothetical protein EWM55_10395 [Enterococcus faecium]|nr:hypothetical protein EWH22_10395 [Enterococcus faecium]QCV47112.1 hypothetical protein EWM55_10395 [Enterococcus faecium]QCV50017.1 hypothetical protein EWM54_09550 [Enterococcus faecium]QCV52937.1 hypothetical protein EWM53_09530 [Enterococcus faecium]